MLSINKSEKSQNEGQGVGQAKLSKLHYNLGWKKQLFEFLFYLLDY